MSETRTGRLWPKRRHDRVLLVAAVLALLVLVVLLLMYRAGQAGPIPPASVDFAALSNDDRARLVERGRYVAQAADCVACHQSEDGHPLAGGTSMTTPMGTLYGTNITASREHGIGDWTPDDLYSSLVWGVGRGGRYLYPAMPYVSYHRITRADSDALWLFLQSVPPNDRPNRPQDLAFPFNIRAALPFWNALFRPDDPADPPTGTAPQQHAAEAPAHPGGLSRGQYLVDVLGHCGECHTPRRIPSRRGDRTFAGARSHARRTGPARLDRPGPGAFLQDGPGATGRHGVPDVPGAAPFDPAPVR